MLAWLNVFILIGVSRAAQRMLGALAVVVGLLNTRDGLRKEGSRERSPHIPQAAKPTVAGASRLAALMVSGGAGAAAWPRAGRPALRHRQWRCRWKAAAAHG